jgi:hypothetical protein
MPASVLARHWFWLLLAHAGLVARHLSVGHFRLLGSIYLDAFAAWKMFAYERRRFRRHVKLSSAELTQRFSSRFYREGYFRLVLAQMRASVGRRPA